MPRPAATTRPGCRPAARSSRPRTTWASSRRSWPGRSPAGIAFDVTTNWNQVKQLLGQDLPRTFLGQVSVAEAINGLTPRLDVLMQQHQDNIRQAAARKG